MNNNSWGWILQSSRVVSVILRSLAVAVLAVASPALYGIRVVRTADTAPAASQPRSSLAPSSAKKERHASGQGKTIKIEVALVTVPVIVTDRKGRFVSDLKSSDFRIFEDGVPQVIDRLIPDADPFNIALMIDSSGSTHFKFDDMQDAALEFVDSLRPQDRVLVVSFGDETHMDSDFTADRALLRNRIHETVGESGQTRLYDALQQVTQERLDRVAGRKAVVLFTDGVDNESRQTGAADTLSAIEKSEIVAYAIQYDTRKDFVPDRFQVPLPPGYPSFNTLYNEAVRYLRALTSHSGGRVYRAESTASLKEAFAQIAEELRRQYTLCYYPADQKRDGTFRRIKVTVGRTGAVVRARTGYRPAR